MAVRGDRTLSAERGAAPAGWSSALRGRWRDVLAAVALAALLIATAGALALPLPRAASTAIAATLLLAAAAGVSALLITRQRSAMRAWAALEIERAEREADAAAVVHDIRGPLVTVHSYLELLVGEAFGPLPDDARRAAERATHAAGRAQALVDEMLRRQALETARAEITPAAAAVDLDGVLRDVLMSLEAELQAAGAMVQALELPRARGDGEALFRIFVNLIENAIKYARPGEPPRLLVSGATHGDRCEISVRDWGTGIEPGERTRIFDHGTRGAGAGDRPGAGIGLAIVRELVIAQGGRVWVDPAVVDGTCIRVLLPSA